MDFTHCNMEEIINVTYLKNYYAKYSDFSMSLYRKIVYKSGERLNEPSIKLIKSLLFRSCPMVFFKEIMSALCQTADFP